MAKRGFPSLTAYLIATGSSQSDLAKRIGVGQSAVNQWLRRRRTPKPHLALKLHRLTGVPFEVLLRKRPRRQPHRVPDDAEPGTPPLQPSSEETEPPAHSPKERSP